jgi:ComF family protein
VGGAPPRNRAHRGIGQQALRAAADFFLPVCCAVCDTLLDAGERDIVCGRCWTQVHQLPFPRCQRCGHPVTTHSCRWCENLPPFVRSARSYCWIGAGSGKDIVHALKYDGWTKVAAGMARRMARVTFPPDVVEERTALVPIPLSRSRRRERGFNQTELIAASLGPLWKIPVWANVLVRVTSLQSQTQLTPGERKGNVAGAFSVPALSRSALGGAHLILIDDVVTTGATLRAAAASLFAAGARTISYMTFGRAPASGDRLIP